MKSVIAGDKDGKNSGKVYVDKNRPKPLVTRGPEVVTTHVGRQRRSVLVSHLCNISLNVHSHDTFRNCIRSFLYLSCVRIKQQRKENKGSWSIRYHVQNVCTRRPVKPNVVHNQSKDVGSKWGYIHHVKVRRVSLKSNQTRVKNGRVNISLISSSKYYCSCSNSFFFLNLKDDFLLILYFNLENFKNLDKRYTIRLSRKIHNINKLRFNM